MITLGIETSCDETSVAVLENGDRILSNVVSSSLKQHQPYGGVVPEIASRHSLENIHFVFNQAMTQAGKSLDDIDLISVTYGPGLIGSLLVGLNFAKALSFSKGIPWVGVNHLEAHLESNFIEHPSPDEPWVGMVVSGGHTVLVLSEDGHYKILGTTVDDAVGEAYDKVAKLMQLGYPGGPILDKMSAKGNSKRFRFTKPKMSSRLDFSFSGIKTAVLHVVEDLGDKLADERENIAASFQHAVIGWLVDGVKEALSETGVKYVLVGGGVSANSLLREQLKSLAAELDISIWIPPISLTIDNAAMIARSGYERFSRDVAAVSDFTLSAYPNLKIGSQGGHP